MNQEKGIDYTSADLFAIPVSLFGTRKKQFYGSLPGFFLSIIFTVVIIGFIGYKNQIMMLGRLDKHFSEYMANDFSGHSNNIKIEDYNFLPSIQVDLLDGSQGNRDFIANPMKMMSFGEQIDIWDGPINQKPYPKIDFMKFNRYF